MTDPESTAPHRVILSAQDLAYLVELLDLSLPPRWHDNPPDDLEAARDRLLALGVVERSGTGAIRVHPSVALNLHILAQPDVMLTTVSNIARKRVRCVHAVTATMGASLFVHSDHEREISLFPAVNLGRELTRAVPRESPETEELTKIFGQSPPHSVRGTLPLKVVEELGIAATLNTADTGTVEAVLNELALAEELDRLAQRLSRETDGLLTCSMMGRSREPSRKLLTGQFVWIHVGAEWVGLRTFVSHQGEKLVQLEPVFPVSLGVWAAGFLSQVLA